MPPVGPFRDSPLPLAAILAGGASRRFGSPKALAEVDGRPLIERVRDALRAVVSDPVLITSRPEAHAGLDLPTRPDGLPGGGPMAGLHAALRWAEERGRDGVLLVACDLPFLDPGLLRRLVDLARAGESAAVAPEGPGPFGIEPLCAWYSNLALPEVERRLAGGDLSMGGLLAALGAERLSLAEVRAFGRPDVLFHNVNTRADRLAAETIARASRASHADP